MTQVICGDALIEEIDHQLKNEGATVANLQAILELILNFFGCVVGTIHALEPETNLLRLQAQRGIPENIFNQVSVIPVGKGMAGLAASRREAVQVCNLQTDASGVAKPGAKETKMEGSIAVPILVGETVQGAMGIAKPEPYEFSQDETALLLHLASLIGNYLT